MLRRMRSARADRQVLGREFARLRQRDNGAGQFLSREGHPALGKAGARSLERRFHLLQLPGSEHARMGCERDPSRGDGRPGRRPVPADGCKPLRRVTKMTVGHERTAAGYEHKENIQQRAGGCNAPRAPFDTRATRAAQDALRDLAMALLWMRDPRRRCALHARAWQGTLSHNAAFASESNAEVTLCRSFYGYWVCPFRSFCCSSCFIIKREERG